MTTDRAIEAIRWTGGVAFLALILSALLRALARTDWDLRAAFLRSREMKFKLGSKVAWSSQSAGTLKEKHGEIFRIVQPGQPPLGGAEFVLTAGVYSLPGGGFGLPRNHESYLVEVREGKRKPKLYWPRVSALEAD
jgi:hypothetical protein